MRAVVASQPVRTDSLQACPFADQLDFQNDFLGDAVHGQVAGHIKGIVPRLLDRLAFESSLGEFGGIEKIGRSQVVVPHFDAGVNARCFDAHLNRRLLWIRFVELNRAGKIVEFARDIRKQVPDLKPDR